MKLCDRTTKKLGAGPKRMAMASNAPKRMGAAKKSAPRKPAARKKVSPKKAASAKKTAAKPSPAPNRPAAPMARPAAPPAASLAARPANGGPRPAGAAPSREERRKAATRKFFARLRSLEAIVGADLRKRGSVVLMQAVDQWYNEAINANATDVSITSAAKAVIAHL
jgi:hypothetical protein